MTPHELVSSGQDWLGKRYPGYGLMAARERRVLAAAWLCDTVKPREKTGRNDGELVEAIQAAGGGSKGQAWCAYAQNVVALVSRTWHPGHGVGAVLSWLEQGRNLGKAILVKSATRGDLLIRNPGDGSHHIGILVRRVGMFYCSIEGNTSAGEQGSQNDGQGAYRRARLAKFWQNALKGD